MPFIVIGIDDVFPPGGFRVSVTEHHHAAAHMPVGGPLGYSGGIDIRIELAIGGFRAAAVAGLAVGQQIIEDENCVAKSFPDFWERFEVFYK